MHIEAPSKQAYIYYLQGTGCIHTVQTKSHKELACGWQTAFDHVTHPQTCSNTLTDMFCSKKVEILALLGLVFPNIR